MGCHTEQHKVIFPKNVPGEGLRQREEMRLTLPLTQRATSTAGFTLLLQCGTGFNKVQLLFRASEKNRDVQEAQRNVKKPRDLVIILLFLVFITVAAGNTHVMVQLLFHQLDLNFLRLHRAIKCCLRHSLISPEKSDFIQKNSTGKIQLLSQKPHSSKHPASLWDN